MNLKQIAETLNLENLTVGLPLDEPASVDKAHASDLLSDVLANAPAGGLLITIQVHMNVVAVALHAGLKAVVFASGMRPPEEVRAKAVAEGISLFAARESTFDVVGKLYALGLRGK
ncbi:MAG TPA: serine kinase [Spirochaetia bacterium]|nr:serine kinase [Spirochaetia bacterium]